MTFPEFQRAVANGGKRGRDAEIREEQSKDNSAALELRSGSSFRNLHNIIFEPFCRTKPPNKWKNYLMEKEDHQNQTWGY